MGKSADSVLTTDENTHTVSPQIMQHHKILILSRNRVLLKWRYNCLDDMSRNRMVILKKLAIRYFANLRRKFSTDHFLDLFVELEVAIQQRSVNKFLLMYLLSHLKDYPLCYINNVYNVNKIKAYQTDFDEFWSQIHG